MKSYVLFWNLQRLFDPSGLPTARELSSNSRDWALEHYERKIENLALCIKTLTNKKAPAVLCFAEVESVRILKDMCRLLGWNNIAIVDELISPHHLDGLDVAMLVNSDLFEVSSLTADSLSLDNRLSTRDLLHVTMCPKGNATRVHFFACHWPSRVIAEGVHLRNSYSTYLFRRISSILKFRKSDLVDSDGNIKMPSAKQLLSRWNSPCFIVGDFNDEPYDRSVRVALNSGKFKNLFMRSGHLSGKALEEADNYLSKSLELFNPCWAMRFSDDNDIGGTYYRGEWRSYDQILMTYGALAEDSPVKYVEDSTQIGRIPDQLDTNGKVRVSMQKSTGTPKEFSQSRMEGVSDHFPVIFEILLS